MAREGRDMAWGSLFEPRDMLKKANQDLQRAKEDLAQLDSHKVPYSVIDFCLSVYHVRDWLIHGSGQDRRVVDEFINNTAALSVMRDLCNGSKHYGLDLEYLRKGAQPTVKESGLSATGRMTVMGLPEYKLKIRAEHSSPVQSRDFEYWADKAIEAWNRYYDERRI